MTFSVPHVLSALTGWFLVFQGLTLPFLSTQSTCISRTESLNEVPRTSPLMFSRSGVHVDPSSLMAFSSRSGATAGKADCELLGEAEIRVGVSMVCSLCPLDPRMVCYTLFCTRGRGWQFSVLRVNCEACRGSGTELGIAWVSGKHGIIWISPVPWSQGKLEMSHLVTQPVEVR
jgi:hypothetical protein